MRYDIISSIIASVIAIILFLIAIAVILYEKQKKSAALNKKADEDWLFSNFQRSIYNLFFKKSSSESLCGISRSEYKRYCRILHEPAFVNFQVKDAFTIKKDVPFCDFIVWVTHDSS